MAQLGEIVGGGFILVQIIYITLVIGIPALVVWGAISMIRRSRGRDTMLPDPEEILKVRLARGEISVEEYEQLQGLIRFDR